MLKLKALAFIHCQVSNSLGLGRGQAGQSCRFAREETCRAKVAGPRTKLLQRREWEAAGDRGGWGEGVQESDQKWLGGISEWFKELHSLLTFAVSKGLSPEDHKAWRPVSHLHLQFLVKHCLTQRKDPGGHPSLNALGWVSPHMLQLGLHTCSAGHPRLRLGTWSLIGSRGRSLERRAPSPVI